MPTYKEVCETIERADFLRARDGQSATAEQIFKYSPTGELFMLHEWYETAKAILAERETKEDK